MKQASQNHAEPEVRNVKFLASVHEEQSTGKAPRSWVLWALLTQGGTLEDSAGFSGFHIGDGVNDFL